MALSKDYKKANTLHKDESKGKCLFRDWMMVKDNGKRYICIIFMSSYQLKYELNNFRYTFSNYC